MTMEWFSISTQGDIWLVIGIDTNILVIVVSLTNNELSYQFLFYHDETKLMTNKQLLSI